MEAIALAAVGWLLYKASKKVPDPFVPPADQMPPLRERPKGEVDLTRPLDVAFKNVHDGPAQVTGDFLTGGLRLA